MQFDAHHVPNSSCPASACRAEKNDAVFPAVIGMGSPEAFKRADGSVPTDTEWELRMPCRSQAQYFCVQALATGKSSLHRLDGLPHTKETLPKIQLIDMAIL
jgi:hypothetical protein